MDKKNLFEKVKLAAINDDPYEYCWQTGDYIDQDCEQCDHKWECSGYTGGDED